MTLNDFAQKICGKPYAECAGTELTTLLEAAKALPVLMANKELPKKREHRRILTPEGPSPHHRCLEGAMGKSKSEGTRRKPPTRKARRYEQNPRTKG